MKLVRTFHPVGHGAFYTEKFYDEDKCVYTAVYDCGSASPKRVHLKNMVQKEFPVGSKIDALFISHFDKDHTNGIQYLLDYCKKIYIPALTPLEEVVAFVYNASTKTIYTDANILMKKIFADDETRDRVVKVASFKGVENIDGQKEEKDGVLPVGAHVSVGSTCPYWIYYPFHLDIPDNPQLLEQFANAIKEGKVDFEELKAIIEEKGVATTKRIVNAKIPTRKRNYYSMTVYSGHKHSVECLICGCDCCEHKFYDCFKTRCQSKFDACKADAHCLYMGDYETSRDNVKSLIDFYKCYMCSSKTIQVPHHGSSSIGGAYDYNIYNCCRNAVISTGHYTSIPFDEVEKQLKIRKVTPIIVDYNPISKKDMSFNI